MGRALALAMSIFFGCATASADPARPAPRPARAKGVRFDPRPLDALLAEAARTGKRVVVDFHAPW